MGKPLYSTLQTEYKCRCIEMPIQAEYNSRVMLDDYNGPDFIASPSPRHHLRTTTMSATAQFESIYHGLSPTPGSQFPAPLSPSSSRHSRPDASTLISPAADLCTSAELRIAPSGLGWKSSDENESVVTVPGAEIKWIQWIRCVPPLRSLELPGRD